MNCGVALPELGQAPQVVAQTGLVSHDVRRSAVFLQEHGAPIEPYGTPGRHLACSCDQAAEQAVAAYDEPAIMKRIFVMIPYHCEKFPQSQERKASPLPFFPKQL